MPKAIKKNTSSDVRFVCKGESYPGELAPTLVFRNDSLRVILARKILDIRYRDGRVIAADIKQPAKSA